MRKSPSLYLYPSNGFAAKLNTQGQKMLYTKILQSQSAQILLPLRQNYFVAGKAGSFLTTQKTLLRPLRKHIHFRACLARCSITGGGHEKFDRVKAVVKAEFSGRQSESLGSLFLELASAQLDFDTGEEKPTVKGFALPVVGVNDVVRYVCEDMLVPDNFGELGAVLVVNEHDTEMFIRDIHLVAVSLNRSVTKITCNSWIQPKSIINETRVFFTNKSYLPSQTPSGLWRMREKELRLLRGTGKGERKPYERIYDYDVYNDLGDPDKGKDLARPVVGGSDCPYPRRCRTGRPPTKADPNSESKSKDEIYVPMDEAFSIIKAKAFRTKMHAMANIIKLNTRGINPDTPFPSFTAIDLLFDEAKKHKEQFPWFIEAASQDGTQNDLKFKIPESMNRDKFSWLSDMEFGRHTIAGLNPFCIRLVTEQDWPFKSSLDPKIYGPQESQITTELIELHIKGFMTVEEALMKKKLFILDYHDLLLPYVNKIREHGSKILYASRTLFFLTPHGTLIPVAIELTRPPVDKKRQWKKVFQPSWDATNAWLWTLAKIHVLAHDTGYHQLISHWLRTHCCMEPYVIAAKRQLSEMHPIYRLLRPHFRYTMKINAEARKLLISAGGTVETTFFPGKYSVKMSSDVYDKLWKFNLEGLPADLIHRGLAARDENENHGLKLAIEDFPFANDGLILWDAIKEWVTTYVNHYYHHPTIVQSDKELQAWWNEVRTVGHKDKKDEPWWPVLNTNEDMIGILTTIIWIASGHHAAVNFGLYDYAGYFPNRPSIARTTIPNECEANESSWENFKKRPEHEILACFPSQVQAITLMAALDVLSDHSPDEEYIGKKIEPSWKAEPAIRVAFERFKGRMNELEEIIDARNTNDRLKNRNGAGVLPYKLLKPFSRRGATGKGVPNSISI